MRLHVVGEGGDPEEPPWSPELGSDRRLSTEVFFLSPLLMSVPKPHLASSYIFLFQ